MAPGGWRETKADAFFVTEPGRKEKMMPNSSHRISSRAAIPASVVVPTFREAANIPNLVKRIHAVLSKSGIEWELLIIDDDSDDGSATVVENLARQFPVRMITRRDAPRDLSLAVLEGIRLSRFDRIVVMDADLSHPPEHILDLLVALDADCDMAVGSRYMAGGSVDRTWGLWRFLNSRLATVLARPLANCSDPMSGFFAIDRRWLPDRDTLRPIGYKIALELMVRGQPRVTEVPIAFHDRNVGDSKMNWKQQFNYLRHLRRLYQHRFGNPVRLLFFGLVGVSGFLIDAAGYLGLQQIGIEHRLARGLSFWPAVTWNWWLNRTVTFSDRQPRPHGRQWIEFVVGSLVGFAVSWGSYVILTTFSAAFAHHQMLAFVSGVGLGGMANFLIANRYVYRAGIMPTGNAGKKTTSNR